MSAFYDLASVVLVPSGYKSGKIYAQKPLTTDGQLTFTRASTATRVNASGLIETVASGVPRLDYLGSSCPKLQLEPQRTNSLLRNQDFSSSWGFSQCTLGAAQSGPGGSNTAYRITNGATANDPFFEQSVTTQTGVWTWSVFVKQGTAAEAWIYPVHVGLGSDTSYAQFNFATKTFNNIGNIASAGYEMHANGWYRIWCTVNITAGVSSLRARFSSPQVANVYNDWAYPQLEFGSYITSVILTTSAAVTRLADACSKTGISSLIGQTEGTLFLDFVWGGIPNTLADSALFSIGLQQYGTSSIAISSYNGALYARVTNGISVDAAITFGAMTNGTRYKAALAYANNDVIFYVNGVNYGGDTSVSIPTLSDTYLQNSFNNAKGINQALLFKTRLTNAQLAELTTL